MEFQSNEIFFKRYINFYLKFSKNKTQLRAFVILLSCLSAIGGFLFGYDTGVISGAMIQLRVYFNLTYFYQELIVRMV